jgi:hypothetical protein
MDTVFLLSSIALGLSAIVTLVKLFGFTLTTNPRTLIRLGQWVLFFFAIAAVPAIVVLLVLQHWVAAMLVATGFLLSVALLNRRLLTPRRTAFRPAWQEGGPPPAAAGNGAHGPDEEELVARAAAVLQAYLDHAGMPSADSLAPEARRPPKRQPEGDGPGGPMSRPEALAVLGLEEGVDAKAIRAAHRRLLQLLHPDRGGTNYLAAKVNEAKDTLLAGPAAHERPRSRTRPTKQKRADPAAH